MSSTPPIVLAHAAEPAVLIGGPLLMIAIFLLLERGARKRERHQDQKDVM